MRLKPGDPEEPQIIGSDISDRLCVISRKCLPYYEAFELNMTHSNTVVDKNVLILKKLFHFKIIVTR